MPATSAASAIGSPSSRSPFSFFLSSPLLVPPRPLRVPSVSPPYPPPTLSRLRLRNPSSLIPFFSTEGTGREWSVSNGCTGRSSKQNGYDYASAMLRRAEGAIGSTDTRIERRLPVSAYRGDSRPDDFHRTENREREPLAKTRFFVARFRTGLETNRLVRPWTSGILREIRPRRKQG